jgi:hypothetical protein
MLCVSWGLLLSLFRLDRLVVVVQTPQNHPAEPAGLGHAVKRDLRTPLPGEIGDDACPTHVCQPTAVPISDLPNSVADV